jgi:hypothetical protein
MVSDMRGICASLILGFSPRSSVSACGIGSGGRPGYLEEGCVACQLTWPDSSQGARFSARMLPIDKPGTPARWMVGATGVRTACSPGGRPGVEQRAFRTWGRIGAPTSRLPPSMPELGWHEAIVKVLEGAKEPLHYTQIAEEVAQQGLRVNLGATPASTVSACLSSSIKTDGESRRSRGSTGACTDCAARSRRPRRPGRPRSRPW